MSLIFATLCIFILTFLSLHINILMHYLYCPIFNIFPDPTLDLAPNSASVSVPNPIPIPVPVPVLLGPCGGVPSRLHAKTIHAMMRNLEEIRPGFDVMHEFSGKYSQVKSSQLKSSQVNQTNHSTKLDRPCTITHRIKKELSSQSVNPHYVWTLVCFSLV